MPLPYRFASGPLELAGYLAVPPRASAVGSALRPGIVICHGFPSGGGRAAAAASTHPELADRIATELGMVALAFAFRGAAESQGDFSLAGWLEDVHAATDHLLERPDIDGVWLAGFGTGGALSICAGAEDKRVRGVAALGAPADFDDWAGQPRRLLDYARGVGLITRARFPENFDQWSRELREIRAVACVKDLVPRPLLVVHGTEDEAVPEHEARLIADTHGGADLRFISGAGHALRHDPRAVAVLLGWLDRERHRRRAERS